MDRMRGGDQDEDEDSHEVSGEEEKEASKRNGEVGGANAEMNKETESGSSTD